MAEIARWREWTAGERPSQTSQTSQEVHLKVNTGMGRLGVSLDEAPRALALVRESPGLRLAGLLSHFGDADDLLVSGLLQHGDELARRAAVVEVPVGKGNLLLFAINPIWRGSTIGSHPLVWNAILQQGTKAGESAVR